MIGTAVLATDFGFVNSAADGRMDMTCSALGFAGLAVYLTLRERSLRRALVLSHSLAAAACLTHPNGVFAALALAVTTIWLDRKRLQPITAGFVVAPYALAGLVWLAYCVHAPDDFRAQFSANSVGRLDDVLAPWRGVWREINGPLLTNYWPVDTVSGKLKVIGPLISITAMILMLAIDDLRQINGCRLLVCLVCLRFLLLSIVANPKYDYYLIHIAPYFAMTVGIAASYLWSFRGKKTRLACACALALYFGTQTSVTLHRAVLVRGFQSEYSPLIDYLRSVTRPDDLIAGSAELGFGLGFYNPQVTDDVWLGYWSEKKPSLVILDRWYYAPVIEAAIQRRMPTTDYFTTGFGRRFYLVNEIGGYRVYRRRAASGLP
jgi:hypothetical protein